MAKKANPMGNITKTLHCLLLYSLLATSPLYAKPFLTRGSSHMAKGTFDAIWTTIRDYMQNAQGPGLAKKNVAQGTLVSEDIIISRRSFFDMAHRKRRFFEVTITPVAPSRTRITVYAIFLQNVDFDDWVALPYTQEQKNFENTLIQEFIHIIPQPPDTPSRHRPRADHRDAP